MLIRLKASTVLSSLQRRGARLALSHLEKIRAAPHGTPNAAHDAHVEEWGRFSPKTSSMRVETVPVAEVHAAVVECPHIEKGD